MPSGCQKTAERQNDKFCSSRNFFSGFYDVSDPLTDILAFIESVEYLLHTIVHGDSEQIGHVFYDFASGKLRAFDAIFVPAKA